jgi:hypothetical protein
MLRPIATRQTHIALLLLLSLTLFPVCSQDHLRADPILPAARTFYLGMTPWPYDYTPAALEETYRFLGEHTDLVAHHLDDGVPWAEALEARPFPPKVGENLAYRAAQLKDHPIYLALTPIAIGRDGLAGYWGEQSNARRTGAWAHKKFDDPDVIEAYVRFCERLIDLFHPAFVTYGIEVNVLREKSPRAFDRYVEMTRRVYARLKARHPDLPLSLSIQVETYMRAPREQEAAVRKLLAYTDFIAVSSYPYGAADGVGGTYADPSRLPADWFRRIAALAPEKPFAVAETGFQAEDFVFRGKLAIPGNAWWQADYVRWLLQEADALNARFVVWFVPRDYDLLWERLEKMGLPELFKSWRDTGLRDEKAQDRPALRTWDAWLALPRR